MTVYNSEDEITKTIESIFTDDHIEEQVDRDSQGEITKHETFSYNSNGDRIQQTILHDGDTTTHLFQYEYDKHNNWIKQYKLNESGNIGDIVTRDITYFSDY